MMTKTKNKTTPVTIRPKRLEPATSSLVTHEANCARFIGRSTP
jgi:hypothetical protein